MVTLQVDPYGAVMRRAQRLASYAGFPMYLYDFESTDHPGDVEWEVHNRLFRHRVRITG